MRYLLRRLLWTIPVLLTISLITFGLMHAAPGGPWDRGGLRRLPPSVVENLNRQFNLDRPLWEQYTRYMLNALRGDLGPSYQFRDRGVSEILFAPPTGRPAWESRFGRTATLGLLALVIAVAVGLPLGVVAALKPHTWLDTLSLAVATWGTAVPNFVLAVFFIIVFGLWLHVFPVAASDWNDPRAWVLPAVVLSFGTMAYLARLVRASLRDALLQDYIRTARAKGVAERGVILRHALRNSLLPVVTYLGPTLAMLITGSFFVEYIFSFPGLGRLFVQAVSQRDYSMIMGTTLFYGLLISLANLGVDLAYGWLDPRLHQDE